MSKRPDNLIKTQLWRSLSSGEPQFVAPMQCKLVDRLPEGKDWIYELKFDGYRALAIKRGKAVQLISRNAKTLNSRYPELIEELKSMEIDSFVLDGEVVALDENGLPSFQLLQNLGPKSPARQISYFAFDILNLHGKKLRNLPLAKRKEILRSILPPESIVRYSASLEAEPETLVREIRRLSMEGLIAKQRNSVYQPGQRSGSWVKLKVNRAQEFVIGGYRPSGIPNDFELLLVGYFEGRKFNYAAKIKSGFTPHIKKEVCARMQKNITPVCPFGNLPEGKGGRWGESLPKEEMEKCIWVKPKIVCQIQFVEWTAGNHLRHAKFVGLRDDKKASEVVKE
jgi:bifunctional non-homologous end joining protein LigD